MTPCIRQSTHVSLAKDLPKGCAGQQRLRLCTPKKQCRYREFVTMAKTASGRVYEQQFAKIKGRPMPSPPAMWPVIWMAIALAALANGQMMPMQLGPMQSSVPQPAQPPQQQQQPGQAYGQVGGGPSMHGDADKSQLSLGGGYVSRGADLVR